MAGNPSPRKNITRERKDSKKPVFKGGPAGTKKESETAKTLKKDKISTKEARETLTREAKARILKREQKKATKGNKPGIRAGNKNLT